MALSRAWIWVGLVAGAMAAGSFAGCTKSTSGYAGDDEGGADDAGGSSGSSGSSSGSASGSSSGSGGSSGSGSGSTGGSHGTSGSSGGSGSGGSSSSSSGGSSSSSSSGGELKVPSNVLYNDAGVLLCGTPCPLTSNECCIDVLGNGHCMSTGASCPNDAVFKCVEKTDCPSGQVCCGVADQAAATAGSACQDVAATGNHCTPVATSATSTQGSAQLCQTNAECITGSCLWQDCTVGTLSPSLTMCGLQSAAPFNCVAHK